MQGQFKNNSKKMARAARLSHVRAHGVSLALFKTAIAGTIGSFLLRIL